jgi:hypothetical protein
LLPPNDSPLTSPPPPPSPLCVISHLRHMLGCMGDTGGSSLFARARPPPPSPPSPRSPDCRSARSPDCRSAWQHTTHLANESQQDLSEHEAPHRSPDTARFAGPWQQPVVRVGYFAVKHL